MIHIRKGEVMILSWLESHTMHHDDITSVKRLTWIVSLFSLSIILFPEVSVGYCSNPRFYVVLET